jgi:chromosome segregation ATPase
VAKTTKKSKAAAKPEAAPSANATLEAEQAKLAALEAELAELTKASDAAQAEVTRLQRRINTAGPAGYQGALAKQGQQARLLDFRIRGTRAKLAACRAAIAKLAAS